MLELGKHKRFAHGVLGTSINSIKSRGQRALARRQRAAQAPDDLRCPICATGPYKNAAGLRTHHFKMHKSPEETKAHYANGKPKTTIRATRTDQLEIEHHPNGSTQAHQSRDIPEATLAVAFGRFTELCITIAVEYDLPPRLFAHRLSELIYAAQVRQPSRRAMSVHPL